jgi:CRP-like cAMP-binding protein
MPPPQPFFTPSDNRILAALPRQEYERLRPHLERVQLTKGKVIYEAGDRVNHAYFVAGGMLSLLSSAQDGSTVEVAMVGNEGVAGLPAVLRVKVSPYKIVAQVRGEALKIRAHAIRDACDDSPTLRDLLLRYAHALLTQVSQSALCNRFHTVDERLCRWLLVTRDKAGSDSFELTQESLSHMLGAPRTSVTTAASSLRRAGLIRYSRGMITVTDLAGLEAASCECYLVVKQVTDKFMAA